LQFDEMVVKEHPEVYQESVLGVGSNGPGPRIADFLRSALGLATYVSGVLNPGVSESAILGRPEDLAARANPLQSQIARELLQNMDSTSPDLYQTFFLGSSARKDIPPRSGYYVGLLIARELGQSHSLQQLAKMNGESLRSTIRRMLQKMAH
jgi:hypothetical protein